MKKQIFSFLLLCFITAVQAQDKSKTTPPFWTKKGTISLLFNQSSFNKEWQAGGSSNYAGNFALNYDVNYKKDNVVWDNKFIIAYGLTKIKDAPRISKTDDRLELNSLWGKKANGDWYFSAFFNFKTQMDSGYNSDGIRLSHFFSPAYFQIGPGMLWKKSNNLSVNIAPVTTKLIIVDPYFTNTTSSFGVVQGDRTRLEFGTSISGYYKFNLITNVSVENRINLYANYLDHPQNIDVDYQMNVYMKINQFLSANIALQTIYDDNSIQALQTREVFGLGINYGF
jgi:hypothetical protein